MHLWVKFPPYTSLICVSSGCVATTECNWCFVINYIYCVCVYLYCYMNIIKSMTLREKSFLSLFLLTADLIQTQQTATYFSFFLRKVVRQKQKKSVIMLIIIIIIIGFEEKQINKQNIHTQNKKVVLKFICKS